MKPIRYLVEQETKSGIRFYWQPATRDRARFGVKTEALGGDRGEAEEEANRLNDWLDAQRVAGQRPPKHADVIDHLMRMVSKRAKQFGLANEMDAESLHVKLEEQGWRCALTGIQFDLMVKAGHRRPFVPSADRIDCKIGYVPSNVRIVCSALNYALGDWGLEVFDRIARSYVSQKRLTRRRVLKRKTHLR